MAKPPVKPDPVEPAKPEAEEAEDTRSELQKQDEADQAAFDALTPVQKAAHMLDELVEQIEHQVKHSAPIGPHLLAKLQAIREHLG